MTSNTPEYLRYTKSHEWISIEGDHAVIGITDHAQHELTDIVFVELPAVGRHLKSGEACAVVESVKTASDIYTPLSGDITEQNQSLINNPALANSDPYGEGWFFKLHLTQPEEIVQLLSAHDYRALIQS